MDKSDEFYVNDTRRTKASYNIDLSIVHSVLTLFRPNCFRESQKTLHVEFPYIEGSIAKTSEPHLLSLELYYACILI